MPRLPSFAFGLLAFVLASSAGEAHACWDGVAIQMDRVTYTYLGGEWMPRQGQEYFDEGRRLRAILAANQSLVIEPRSIAWQPCEGCDSQSAPRDDTRPLFDQVAALVQATPAVIARAKALRATQAITLQAFATRSLVTAKAVAHRINSAERRPSESFYAVGGFPATRRVARVVVARNASSGKALYRVLVGAYETRAEGNEQRGGLSYRSFARSLARDGEVADATTDEYANRGP